MTPWVGRWQTTPGPLHYKTNKSTAPAYSVLLDISSCQSAPSSNLCFPILCVRARNQCVIIFTHSLAGDTGDRRGIETTRSAPKGHGRSQIHWNGLCFPLSFTASRFKNLSKLDLTEVTHFQSTWFMSEKRNLALSFFSFFPMVWLSECIFHQLYFPTLFTAECHHLLASRCGETIHCALSQQRALLCQTGPWLLLWCFLI